MAKYTVEKESLTAIANKIREIGDLFPAYKITFPDGFITELSNGVKFREGEAERKGYDDGHESGYGVGLINGYDDGYSVGYQIGVDDGYVMGYHDGNMSGWDDGFEEGKLNAYDAFWDAYQINGTRGDYSNCFSGRGWTENTFKPKYDIYTTQGYMLFRYTGITDLGKALNGKKIIINTDTLQYTFNNSLLEIIDGIEYRKPIKKFDGTFHYSSKLREIRNPIPIDATATKLDAFTDCKALEEVRFSGVIPVDLSMSSCYKLSRASIENIINTLSTTTTGKTITLSKTAINKAFETTEGALDGMLSDDFNTLMASRENWTFAFGN